MSGKKWAVKAYGGVANLELMEFPLPDDSQLRDTDVLVKVLATTATYTDQLIIHGNYRPCPPLPCTPGYDCVGVVVKVGKGVTNVAVGDRVASMPQHGCCATHVVLPAHLVIKVRADVIPEQAVSVVLTGVTAYQMLHRAFGTERLGSSTRVLVHACGGGTGAMLVLLAKLAGVPSGNIYGTCSAKSMGVAKDLGITAFDYTSSQDWAAELLKATGGEGVDLVLDSVLLNGYMSKGLQVLRRGGKYVAYGVTDVAAPGTLNLLAAMGAFARLAWQQHVASFFDSKGAVFFNVAEERDKSPDHFAGDLTALIDLVADKQLAPVVGQVWSFEEARAALQCIEENKHKGKQIITVAVAT